MFNAGGKGPHRREDFGWVRRFARQWRHNCAQVLALPWPSIDGGPAEGRWRKGSMAVLIEANGLKKHFGEIVAVDGISLSVERGEVLGFLGPNGAGKSTTMKMLTGFLEPDAGSA